MASTDYFREEDENVSPLSNTPTDRFAPIKRSTSPSTMSVLSNVSSMGCHTPVRDIRKRDAEVAGIEEVEDDTVDDDTISISSHVSVGGGKTPKKRPRLIGRLSNIMRSPFASKSRVYTPKGPQRRNSVRSDVNQSWHETVSSDILKNMAPREKNRQQAIHEVVATEELYVNDLTLMSGLMYKVALEGAKLSEAEMQLLFGNMLALRDMHALLLASLCASRNESGIYSGIGAAFVKATATFGPAYTQYLPNIEQAQHLVKSKSEEPLFQMFLEAVRSLPQTNRQEFLHYLDRPRARLARYCMLLSAALKHTDPSHPDHALLSDAIASIDNVVKEADRATGAAKVERLKAMLKFEKAEERDRCLEILAQSTQLEMECGFTLVKLSGRKINQEVTAYLFNGCMIVVLHKKAEKTLQLFGEPMRLENIVVREDEDECIRVGRASSVRGRFDDRRDSIAPDALAQMLYVRHVTLPGKETVYALRAPSDRVKREWLSCVSKLQTGRSAYSTDARLSMGGGGSGGGSLSAASGASVLRSITRSQTMSVLPDDSSARFPATTPAKVDVAPVAAAIAAAEVDEFIPMMDFEFGELKECTV